MASVSHSPPPSLELQDVTNSISGYFLFVLISGKPAC